MPKLQKNSVLPRHPPRPQDLLLMNSVYKDRFPNATAQMEERLRSFLASLESAEERGAETPSPDPGAHQECLQRSQDKQLSSAFFFDISQKVELLAKETARLLECLEFDPAEFLQLLEAAEGQVRQVEKLQTDIPRYIISKLGLNKDPLDDLVDIETPAATAAASSAAAAAGAAQSTSSAAASETSSTSLRRPPHPGRRQGGGHLPRALRGGLPGGEANF
uniref:Mre11_DNA_bind domain-containing protein n=1 Tax=Macrostomum lignano TaxID=282301 RepID=A0A1I8IVQ0_9PLAT